MTPRRPSSARRPFSGPAAAALVGALAALTGCVPRDAGYSGVRELVAERADGARVTWQHVSGSESRTEVAELLRGAASAERAMRIALLNHPGVQASLEDLGVSRAAWVRALRIPNPEAEAAVRFGLDNPQIELEVMQDVTDFVFLPLRSDVAKSQMEATQAQVAGKLLDIGFAARQAFVTLQASAQLLELRKTVVEATYASLEAARSLREAGNVIELDVANQESLYQEARLLLARAEVAYLVDQQRLAQALGVVALPESWTHPARLRDVPDDAIDLARARSAARQKSLDLRAVEHGYAAAARRANLAEIEGWTPEVKAGVAAEMEESWGVGPAVGVSLPLFYQGQAEVAEAEAGMRRGRAQHRALNVKLETAVVAAVTQLNVAGQTARYYADVLLPLRARVVEQTQLNYNAMSVGVFQLLQAKRDQIQTAQSYVEAMRDYWLARARYDQLMAGRLVEPPMSMNVPAAGATGGASAEAH